MGESGCPLTNSQTHVLTHIRRGKRNLSHSFCTAVIGQNCTADGSNEDAGEFIMHRGEEGQGEEGQTPATSIITVIPVLLLDIRIIFAYNHTYE